MESRSPWSCSCAAGATLADEGVDEGVELGFALTDARHEGQREAHDMPREGQKGERQEAHEGVDGGGDVARFGFDVGIEEAFADDAQREQQHVVMHVAGGAGLPGTRHLERVVADDGAVGGDAVAMESRLGEPALAKVQRLFAGEQAVAEHEASALHDDAAVMMPRVADEHLFDQCGMVELKDVAAGGAEVDEIAVEAGVGAEEFDGAGAEDLSGKCAPDEGWAGWPG